MKLKRITSAILCLSLLVALLAVTCVVGYAELESAAEVGESGERLDVSEGASALDGKKILFAGCSYTYYGGLIERTGASVFSQEKRTSGETGYFVRLAAKNGVKNLTVTDWVYGGHDLSDIFDGEACSSGETACVGRCHLDDLTDRSYDIVILQEILTPGYKTAEEYVESLRMAMDVFLEANPDTKFYLLSHHRLYQQLPGYTPITESVQLAKEQLGIEIIDWGALVYDVTEGIATVEGSEIDYNYHSFVVSNSASDGYHQNILAGYLSTIMTYATLTGETTVGQPYKFIYDLSSKYLNIDKFISTYYKYDNPDTEFNEKATNMKEIFYSDVDMLGLQKLAEEYLTKERWLDFSAYDVEFYAEGELISDGEYDWGEEIVIPDAPVKPSDDRNDYVFVGWDKTVSETCRGNATYTAVYGSIARKYTVTFLDDDGSVLQSGEYEWGDAVTAPAVPGKEDVEYRYTFKSWDKAVVDCAGDATYSATYVRVASGFVVTFRDYDGTLISTVGYKLGDTVTVPADPVRVSDNTYSYAFAGWDKEVVACEGDAEYTATYTATYIDYTVKFLDEDGSLISESTYHWGDEVIAPESPSKPADNEMSYTFMGWGSEVVACDGERTYQAVYKSELIIYSVVFYDDEGEVIVTRNYNWGDVVSPPQPPKKLSDDNYDYSFAGWDREVTLCYGTTSYTAVYTAIPKADGDTPDEPVTPDEPTTPDDPDLTPDGGENVEGTEGGILEWLASLFESIINWFKSLFGIKE